MGLQKSTQNCPLSTRKTKMVRQLARTPVHPLPAHPLPAHPLPATTQPWMRILLTRSMSSLVLFPPSVRPSCLCESMHRKFCFKFEKTVGFQTLYSKFMEKFIDDTSDQILKQFDSRE